MTTNRLPADRERRLARALSKLRPIEREVLLLSSSEKLWNDEVAERLGLTTEEVERHLSSAIRKLVRELRRRERPWWKLW